ncbi:MAG TPA: hypothetical protein VH592_17475 [Gemmataceae bacterium]
MLAADPVGGGTGGFIKLAVFPAGTGSGLPTVTAGAAPRAAPEVEAFGGEIEAPVMRKSRGLSGVAASPLATAAVPGAADDEGIGGTGTGPDVA